MSTSIPKTWLQSYQHAVDTNDRGTELEIIKALSWGWACKEVPLSLDEYIAARQHTRVIQDTAYNPLMMTTVRDWHNSIEQLQHLMYAEKSPMERLIVDHLKRYHTMPETVYNAFHSGVGQWYQQQHKEAWYGALNEDNAMDNIATLTGRWFQRVQDGPRGCIKAALSQVKQGNLIFWSKIQDYAVGHIHVGDHHGRDIINHLLTHLPYVVSGAATSDFIKRYSVKHRDLDDATVARWIGQVIEHSPSNSYFVMDLFFTDRMNNKYNSSRELVFQCEPLLNAPIATSYLLLHATKPAKTILNRYIYGDPVNKPYARLVLTPEEEALQNQAFIRKLATHGADAYDVKHSESWNHVMQAAFVYWMVTHTIKHKGSSPSQVYTHINKDLARAYQDKTDVDLRNPEQFAQWEKSQSHQVAALHEVYNTFCNTWDEACLLYVTVATGQTPAHDHDEQSAEAIGSTVTF